MSFLTPVPDNSLIGLDSHAKYLAIANKTGLGLVPKKIGDVGWFGSERIQTMLCDCGCGAGTDCENQVVRYVVKQGNDFAFLYDDDGDLVVCETQTHALNASQADLSLLEYLDDVQAQYEEAVAPYEHLVDVFMQKIEKANGLSDLMKIQAEMAQLPRQGAVFILGRLKASKEAEKNWKRRQMLAKLFPYVKRLQEGEDLVVITADMRHEGNGELVEVLEGFATDEATEDILGKIFKGFGTDHIQ